MIATVAFRLPRLPRINRRSFLTSAVALAAAVRSAGVKTLVLSHFVPPDDPQVTDAMWLEAARRRFRGTVIVGRDPLEV